MRLSERGIPILLTSLFLTGVGGGLAVAADDPVERLLALRLHTEQAIAQMRTDGDKALADEMERQLPGALSEVADRLNAAMPELPAREPGAPPLKDLQDPAPQDPVADRLARLATFDGTHGNGVYDEAPATLTYEEKVLARYEHQVAMAETHLGRIEEKFEQRWDSLPGKFEGDLAKLGAMRGKLIERTVHQTEKVEEKLAKIEEKKDEQLAKPEEKPKAPDPAPAPAPDPKDKNDNKDK